MAGDVAHPYDGNFGFEIDEGFEDGFLPAHGFPCRARFLE